MQKHKLTLVVSLVISLCLIFSIVLAGCGKGGAPDTSTDGNVSSSSNDNSKEDEKTEEKSEEKTGSVEVAPPGQFPIVSEKVTLNVLMGGTTQVEDFNTNEFTKWYEEKTNVQAVFEVLPVQGGDDKLNLILASGDYPDILMSTGLTASQIMLYGSQGMFIPLNDYIEEYGFEIKKVFEDPETSYAKEVLTNPDGNIYAMPDINQCYHCSNNRKLWIYEPWLKELGLEMPSNLEEYADVLRAFKNNDPNGNGSADEVPLSSEKNSLIAFFMNSFIYCDGNRSMLLYDGKIDVSFNKPEWKEGLKYLKGLYDEGLIDPESFTQDWDQLRQLGENPNEVILGSATGLHMGMFTQFYGESGRWLEYVAVPPLYNGDKKPTTQHDPYQVSPDTVITDKCQYPEVAVRWIDGMYEYEAVMRSIFGRPDEEWIPAEEGDIGINGEPAIYKLLVPWAETVQNITWAQQGPQVRSNTFRMGETAKPEEPLETILYEATKQYEPFNPDRDQLVPPVVFTEEQASELTDLEVTILDYVNQMAARFITGDADIDSEWDTYVKTLDDMNLARFIEIYQEAYEIKYVRD
jgi:putative aldouronate transport system substrate-binding protein